MVLSNAPMGSSQDRQGMVSKGSRLERQGLPTLYFRSLGVMNPQKEEKTMFGRISKIYPFLMTLAMACLLQAQVAFGSEVLVGSEDAGVRLTDVVIYDDWPADSLLDPGTINCSGGDIEWINLFTPICPGSGQIHLRNMAGYGCPAF